MIGNNGILKSIKDVVGKFGDYVAVPFVSGVSTIYGFLQTGYYHIHGASFIYPDKANPVTLTSGVNSWAEDGAITEVIPANTITKAFDIHWCKLSVISADLFGVIDIFSGSVGNEVKICSIPLSRSSVFSGETFSPVQIQQQPANTRISCRFSDSTTNARTVNVKFMGHVYGASL